MNGRTQLLWIGCFDSDEEFRIKSEKGMNTASAQVSQRNLVAGLEAVARISMDSINGSIVPHFPAYRDWRVREVRWTEKSGSRNVSVGYLNLKYVNRLTCRRSMERAADHWLKTRYAGGGLVIFAYGLRSAPMAAAARIRRSVPDARIFCIVTDLPEFMDLGESRFKKLLKKIDGIAIRRLMKTMSGFVLYASGMAEYLSIPDGRWMLMEGSWDPGEAHPFPRRCSRAILYSGALDLRYGVDLLLQSFMRLEDPELELWLTGGGNAEPIIRECAEKDARIRFFGFLPAREDVLRMQAEAALLINMRLPSEKASAYCFPSKLFEYLCSGTPVLSYRLKGIPEEYSEHLLFIEEESIASTCEAIRHALSMSESQRRAMGHAAREFVLSRKNCHAQARRLLEFSQYEM